MVRERRRTVCYLREHRRMRLSTVLLEAPILTTKYCTSADSEESTYMLNVER